MFNLINNDNIHSTNTSCLYISMFSAVLSFRRCPNCTTSFSHSKNIISFNTLHPHPSIQTTSFLSCSFSFICFLLRHRVSGYFDHTLPKRLHLASQSEHLCTNRYFNLSFLFNRPESSFRAFTRPNNRAHSPTK